MRDLWEIKCDIVDRYKDGDDWVYAKGKKTEIELIKELMEVCTNYAQKVHELKEELEVLDTWEAYRKAQLKLSDVKYAFKLWTIGLEELDTAREKLNEACVALRESEDYVKSVKNKLLGQEENNA
jgi:hypothetical protein